MIKLIMVLWCSSDFQCWRRLPICDRGGGYQHSLDHPAFHANVIHDGKDMHPDHAVHVLKVIWHDGHCCPIAKRRQYLSAGFFADERAASLRGFDQTDNG